MRRFRLTIAASLGIILYLAVLLAALRSGSNDWFKLVYSLTFGFLIYAAIAARYRGPVWYGFAVAGWAYFVVGFGPWIDGPYPRSNRNVNRNLITSIVVEVAEGMAPPMAPGTTLGIGSSILWENERANRDGVAHSGLTVLVAILGGLTSRRLGKPGGKSSDLDRTNGTSLA